MIRLIKKYFTTTSWWKRITGSEFYIRLRNPVAFKQQQLEPNFYKTLLRSYPSKNELIFDIGANIGGKSAIFSKLAKKVIAFEPSEKLYERLNKRFNGTNVKIYNLALGSSNKSSELYIVENNEAYNSLNKKHIEVTAANRNIATLETVNRKVVKVEVIENFILKYSIPKFIKIDVEGYEYEVIKGLKTPIGIISFEANLPEFRGETIDSIKYLSLLSQDQYKFNFTTELDFLLGSFVSKTKAIDFIKKTDLKYLEVYAKLL